MSRWMTPGVFSRRGDDRRERSRHLVALVVLGAHLLAKNDHVFLLSVDTASEQTMPFMPPPSHPGNPLVSARTLTHERWFSRQRGRGELTSANHRCDAGTMRACCDPTVPKRKEA